MQSIFLLAGVGAKIFFPFKHASWNNKVVEISHANSKILIISNRISNTGLESFMWNPQQYVLPPYQ